MKILTTDLIRRSEESAVKSGAFSLRDLMFRAGKAAAEIIMQKYDCRNKKITVVCGRGNNGGDGCVIAGILAENGARVTVCTPLGLPATDNAEYYYNKLKFVTDNVSALISTQKPSEFIAVTVSQTPLIQMLSPSFVSFNNSTEHLTSNFAPSEVLLNLFTYPISSTIPVNIFSDYHIYFLL